jgi:hypothetical protein
VQSFRHNYDRLTAAIIGARRARQGLGPFVARDLARHGVRTVAISTTTIETGAIAAAEVARLSGETPQTFIDPSEMLQATRPDIAAILSPPESHEMQLVSTLDSGCHVICEKPLIWGGEPTEPRVAEFVDRFGRAGRVLSENCQWPEVLPSFARLHPGVAAQARDLTLVLSPQEAGVAALRDCLSHLLSLAQAIQTDPHSVVGLPTFQQDSRGIDVTFAYGAPTRELRVTGKFKTSDRRPRLAALAINGHWAHRQIDPASYAMSLSDGEHAVTLEDPMTVWLGRIVETIRAAQGGQSTQPDQTLITRARAIDSVMAAYTMDRKQFSR